MCHWQGRLGQIIPGELLTWHHYILLMATLLMASLKSGKRRKEKRASLVFLWASPSWCIVVMALLFNSELLGLWPVT